MSDGLNFHALPTMCALSLPVLMSLPSVFLLMPRISHTCFVVSNFSIGGRCHESGRETTGSVVSESAGLTGQGAVAAKARAASLEHSRFPEAKCLI